MPWTEQSRLPLRHSLMRWAREHGRKFPWRDTTNPFRVLLAETLLHRTRASTVLPVYERLVLLCPTPAALVGNKGRVRRLLKPLGLRWRVDSLVRMAEQIQTMHSGEVPQSDQELRDLPGVSDYIAGAVRCFATGSREILLDTNVVRVLGRVRGLAITDGARRSREYRDALDDILPQRGSREFYFAIIDLAATVCRPTHPLCGECSLIQFCDYAYEHSNSRTLKTRKTRRIGRHPSTSPSC